MFGTPPYGVIPMGMPSIQPLRNLSLACEAGAFLLNTGVTGSGRISLNYSGDNDAERGGRRLLARRRRR